jgi:hypothetical protein
VKKPAWALGVVAVAVLVVPVLSSGPGFDRDTFKQFVTLRAGTGIPVYWYAIGEVYSSPEGKRLLRIEGSDAARMIPSDQPDTAFQLSRKVFVYRDPETNEILKEYKGKAVIQMVGWRVDRFEDLPASIREYIKTGAPLWMAPPKDLDEIRALQK